MSTNRQDAVMHAGAGARRNRYPSGHEGDAALASFSPAASTLAIYLIGVYTGPAASWQTLGTPLDDHNKT